MKQTHIRLMSAKLAVPASTTRAARPVVVETYQASG
jgi:hypothetical protein